jgi:hypothetical protein
MRLTLATWDNVASPRRRHSARMMAAAVPLGHQRPECSPARFVIPESQFIKQALAPTPW